MLTMPSGNRFNTSKPKMSNTLYSCAPPFLLIRKPTASHLEPSPNASHKSPGPPFHPPEKFGHTLALGRNLLPIHLTHHLPLIHSMTNHIPEVPPPHPCNTTSCNPLAVFPPPNNQLPHHQSDRAPQLNAPGNREKSKRTLTPLAPPFTSPLPHKSTHLRVTPTHHTLLPPKHKKHATGNCNSTLASYNLLNLTTNSTSPLHTFNSKTGIILS